MFDFLLFQVQMLSKDEKKRKVDGMFDGCGCKKKKQQFGDKLVSFNK